ncbi:TPA: tetratricopeptide repeat protein [Candidatus Poribacteria bacterium]|nr:tetratricopeptide repeat protein [Candidatus Poribacteria bacterium]HIO49303.1 tetratricopeptide repeat protein [Candidatus Poribacteria bacterium]
MMQKERTDTIDVESDSFIEFVLNISAFAKRHSKNITIIATIIILGIVLLTLRQQRMQSKKADASVKLTKAFEKFSEAENDWLDSDNANTDQLQIVEAEFQKIFQTYKGTAADQARYNFAKIKYYRGEYDMAKSKFEEISNDKSEISLLVLYARVAIGNCYEQQEQYVEAIKVYETFINSADPNIDMPLRDHVIELAKLSQARCHKKLEQYKEASKIYKSLIAKFEKNLDKAIKDKSMELMESTKSLLNDLPISDRPSVTNLGADIAYDTFVNYLKAFHEYKIAKDIKGGLTTAVRKKFRKFETESNTFVEDLKQAQKNKVEGRISTALFYYDQAVGLSFAPSRAIYEKALFESNKFQYSQN